MFGIKQMKQQISDLQYEVRVLKSDVQTLTSERRLAAEYNKVLNALLKKLGLQWVGDTYQPGYLKEEAK